MSTFLDLVFSPELRLVWLALAAITLLAAGFRIYFFYQDFIEPKIQYLKQIEERRTDIRRRMRRFMPCYEKDLYQKSREGLPARLAHRNFGLAKELYRDFESFKKWYAEKLPVLSTWQYWRLSVEDSLRYVDVLGEASTKVKILLSRQNTIELGIFADRRKFAYHVLVQRCDDFQRVMLGFMQEWALSKQFMEDHVPHAEAFLVLRKELLEVHSALIKPDARGKPCAYAMHTAFAFLEDYADPNRALIIAETERLRAHRLNVQRCSDTVMLKVSRLNAYLQENPQADTSGHRRFSARLAKLGDEFGIWINSGEIWRQTDEDREGRLAYFLDNIAAPPIYDPETGGFTRVSLEGPPAHATTKQDVAQRSDLPVAA